MDAGEIFKAEFVGAVGAVPRTRFLHLSLRLLARSLGPIVSANPLIAPEPSPPTLGRRLATLNITRPPASVRPYIEPHSFCQDQVRLKPNRMGSHAFLCCSAAEPARFRMVCLHSITGAFLAENA